MEICNAVGLSLEHDDVLRSDVWGRERETVTEQEVLKKHIASFDRSDVIYSPWYRSSYPSSILLYAFEKVGLYNILRQAPVLLYVAQISLPAQPNRAF